MANFRASTDSGTECCPMCRRRSTCVRPISRQLGAWNQAPDVLWRYLNSSKCMFQGRSGAFLGGVSSVDA
jgi:hypothetical protein